jgi:hypothetical protein
MIEFTFQFRIHQSKMTEIDLEFSMGWILLFSNFNWILKPIPITKRHLYNVDWSIRMDLLQGNSLSSTKMTSKKQHFT